MTNRAVFLFSFSSEKDATVVAQSLSPEIQHKIPRSQVVFCVKKNVLEVVIESDEVSSLRAACNSYLRWIQTALAVKNLV
jgi:tRNA threonylcarbamoyladenosine modification (KEOPS) complex  Pcc1 subunit